MNKKLSDLTIGELFSFSKEGSVHMVSNVLDFYIEYKSYNDGKIRIAHSNRDKTVFIRLDYEKRYDLKWFKPYE